MSELDGTLKFLIATFSGDGATMVVPNGGNAKPASSLQISFMIWKNFMPKILASYSDNELRQLAYSDDTDVRRFVSDLIVLQVRQKLSAPPLEPGESLVVSTQVYEALGAS